MVHAPPDIFRKQIKEAPSVETDDPDLACWMARLPDIMPVARVGMPGAHDAATFEHWSPLLASEIVRGWTQTQEWSLRTQLNSGIRFFDLRVKSDGWLYHGPVVCCLTLADALETCHAYLAEHSSEFILVRVKDEGTGTSSGQQVHELVMECSKHLPLELCKSPGLVGEARGRILVLQDWLGPTVTMRWAGPSMCIQDDFRQASAEQKWRAVRKHLRLTQLHAGQELCVNFVSAHSLPQQTARDFAQVLNPLLSSFFELKRPPILVGVVVLDFPTVKLCEQIVRTNFVLAQPAVLREVLDAPSTCYRSVLRSLDARLRAEQGDHVRKKLGSLYAQLLVGRALF
eukprot:CAMPEP_0168420024 /NCGR_PEP_ID=MMETSP0228-20121227/32564_1 /TAXON_ID=133427 /ORGANISM="Protoceratium reticulatum, Strain CCCM 535 (=CCMP 1889)" /LENGTH=342 /DNA_ID=CAMNT_0008433911 /DNA_START=8 /DNA_END=1033 /DNA_ORIENTATION=+